MKEVIKREILKDLTEAISILEHREVKDYEELKVLSDQAVEDVALHKDLDVISVTVMLYSIYKIVANLSEEDYNETLKTLQLARKNLQNSRFGAYNRNIRRLFAIIKKSDAKVKTHLDDVMQAARIKKGTVLVQKGLSIGQAAGLMGLSNWDLQQYASKTPAFKTHEKVRATVRLKKALQIFGVSK